MTDNKSATAYFTEYLFNHARHLADLDRQINDILRTLAALKNK